MPFFSANCFLYILAWIVQVYWYRKCKMFKLKKINVTYQEDKILHDLSFQIQSGEFVYLTGKSGAGKSSLLRLLHGELSFSGDFIFENVMFILKCQTIVDNFKK